MMTIPIFFSLLYFHWISTLSKKDLHYSVMYLPVWMKDTVNAIQTEKLDWWENVFLDNTSYLIGQHATVTYLSIDGHASVLNWLCMMQISFHWKFLSKPEQFTQTFQNKAKLDCTNWDFKIKFECCLAHFGINGIFVFLDSLIQISLR